MYGGNEIKQSKVYEVDADATSVNVSLFKDDVPEGWELASVGDAPIMEDGFVSVDVRPTLLKTTLTVTIETKDGAVLDTIVMGKNGKYGEKVEFVLGEDYQLPEGYVIASDEIVTDISIDAGSVGGHTVVVKRELGTMVKVVFQNRQGNVIAGGDYFVDEDGDGVANFSELPIPEGYELIVTGDFLVADYLGKSNVIVLSKLEEEVPVDPEEPTNPEKPETPDKDSEEKEDSVKKETEKKAPKTGDTSAIATAVVPMGISLAAVLEVLRRKFRK